MATTKTTTLTFRIEPGVKEALGTAAEREHRSIANIADVLIRDYCGRHGITIQEQPALFLGGGPQTATARTIRSHDGPQEIRTLLLPLEKLRRAARRHGRLAVQGLRPRPALREIRLGQVRRPEGRAARRAQGRQLRRHGRAQGRQGDRRQDQQDHRQAGRGQRPQGRDRRRRLQRRGQARQGQGDGGPALQPGRHLRQPGLDFRGNRAEGDDLSATPTNT